jgi:hypothetical protein
LRSERPGFFLDRVELAPQRPDLKLQRPLLNKAIAFHNKKLETKIRK